MESKLRGEKDAALTVQFKVFYCSRVQWECPVFDKGTVDGRNPAPPDMYETL